MSLEAVKHVLKYSRANGGTRLVLVVLAEHYGGPDRGCWPSLARIARQANITERHARRCLRELEVMGEITTSREEGRAVPVYRVVDLTRLYRLSGDTQVRGTPASPERQEAQMSGGEDLGVRGGGPRGPPFSGDLGVPQNHRTISEPPENHSLKGRERARGRRSEGHSMRNDSKPVGAHLVAEAAEEWYARRARRNTRIL